MIKLTTEQLIEQASHNLLLMKSQLSDQHFNIALMADLKLMEIAITALESKPFAYMHRSGQVVTRDECSCEEVFEICCKVDTPLYSAPVLPKRHELIGMQVSIDTGGDNIGHRLFGEIVGTSDSNGVPVLCIEVTENNGDVAAPAQPVSEPKAEGDFLSRLKAEHVELEDRYIKLANFIQVNPEFKKLAPRMQRLLESQTAAMVDYASILECRIDLIEDASASAQEQK